MLTSHYETDNSHLSTCLEDEFSEDESEPFIRECHRLTDDKLTLKARSWVFLVAELTEVSRRSARVFLHGVGREGLMLKAFAMRPFHLGLSSHLASDVTTPPISSPDLLIASAGPGGSPPSMRFAPSRNRAVLKLCSSPRSQREVLV
ncbi:unnamed protein product [Brassica oleracea]